MERLPAALVLAIVALFVIAAGSAAADDGRGAVRGAITDTSGAALPGVTVVATSPDGRVLATTVTDPTGAYELGALPTGQVRLRFQLDGFANGDATIAIEPDAIAMVAKRLELARVTETVVVVGNIVDAAAAVPTPPPPEIAPLPVHDRDSVCGPAKPPATPESFGTIRSRRETPREMYASDDQLVIDGGTLDGLEVGQNLAVRRYFRISGAAGAPASGEHTAGVLQIVSAREHDATAIVVYVCDEMRKGDFLAAFSAEPVRNPEAAGVPDYDAAAQILFADAGQMLGAPRRKMVIDRGSERGVHVGQRLTLFRRRAGRGAKRSIVGDAVVVAIREDSATI